MRAGTLDPETRDPDTRDPGNGFLGLGNCSPKTQSPESRTLRIELVTQIPSITARTTDWINFNCEATFDYKKLGHKSKNVGARVDGPKHLPKYLTWHKEIRKYLKVVGKCVDQVCFVGKGCTHIFTFFCFSIHDMCDSSVACIALVIILSFH